MRLAVTVGKRPEARRERSWSRLRRRCIELFSLLRVICLPLVPVSTDEGTTRTVATGKLVERA